MPPGFPLTCAELARRAGVSTFTVSRALSGKSGVSESTRRRVLDLARSLGYRRNLAAAWLGQRRRGAIPQAPLIAFIGGSPWSSGLFLEACRDQGYDGIWIGPEESKRHGLWRELHTRGVDGLILDARGHTDELASALESLRPDLFPMVKIGRGLPSISSHLIRLSAFDYMWVSLERVAARGYRKIAVILVTSVSPRDNAARLGAILSFAEGRRREGIRCVWIEVPSYLGSPQANARLVQWVRRSGAEALLVMVWGHIPVLRSAGLRFPEEIACAAVIRPEDLEANWPGFGLDLAGCRTREKDGFERALALLGPMIASSHRGPPSDPVESVLEPEWVDGASLPDRTGRLG
ncbi:MAG: LacI family DNA-binding transcriptional regulator [Verrucomicrobiia bacterium]